jgi:hypothetical protein
VPQFEARPRAAPVGGRQIGAAPYDGSARWVYARAGGVDQARRLLRQYGSAVPEGIRREGFLSLAAMGAGRGGSDRGDEVAGRRGNASASDTRNLRDYPCPSILDTSGTVPYVPHTPRQRHPAKAGVAKPRVLGSSATPRRARSDGNRLGVNGEERAGNKTHTTFRRGRHGGSPSL